MRILYLSSDWTIGLFFIIWPILQFAAFSLASRLFDRYLTVESSLFKSGKWEQGGAIYNRLFKIHRWKGYLPDGGTIVRKDFNKKKLQSFSREQLNRFLNESCRAELSHWIAIAPFWIFGLFAPAKAIFYMLIYALAVNLPCIMAQRYNRPRVIRLLNKKRQLQDFIENASVSRRG